MKSFIVTAVLAVAFVASSSTVVHAQPQKKSIAVNKSLSINNSSRPLIGSYNGCYRLQSYCGWSSCCYYPQYGCYAYFCPQDGLWYYWCAALCRYVPVTYITVYRPTTVGVVVLQQGAYLAQTAPGIQLPAGAAALPAGGVNFPAGGATLPAGGTNLPAGGVNLPAGGTSLPGTDTTGSGAVNPPAGGGSNGIVPMSFAKN